MRTQPLILHRTILALGVLRLNHCSTYHSSNETDLATSSYHVKLGKSTKLLLNQPPESPEIIESSALTQCRYDDYA